MISHKGQECEPGYGKLSGPQSMLGTANRNHREIAPLSSKDDSGGNPEGTVEREPSHS